ncbi:MAG TPA: potassium/proton antiporter [Thermoanaerobaculia bacterium]|nr:potassium/proton antiporter [Thermoanaerobaculia bacterium]
MLEPLGLESALLLVAALLLLSVVASRASGRLGVPALLLFVGIGMLAGSEGPGGIWFDDYAAAQRLGVLALIYILFSGALDTQWREVRMAWAPALSLSTVGVLSTALLVAWFAHAFLAMSLLEGFLLGSIVSSTDAAAVFAVLRARGLALPDKLKSVLEVESGSNDPMAVFLTATSIQLLSSPEIGMGALGIAFVRQMALGALLGSILGWLAVRMINRLRLEYDGLYPVLTLAIAGGIFGLASRLGANGFLAVYAAGLVLAKSSFLRKRTLRRFHDGIAWLMQIAMFLTLGLLMFPSQLLPVAGPSLAVAAFLILVARPLAVFVSLAPFRFTVRENLFLSWVGLRGAVPIILATFPLLAGVPQGIAIFNLVFFVVLTSVLIQGTTIPLAARLLGIAGKPDPESPLAPRGLSDIVTIALETDSPAAGQPIVRLSLPDDTLVLLIHRSGEYFVPDGSTILRAEDRLIVFTSKISIDGVRATLAGDRPSYS